MSTYNSYRYPTGRGGMKQGQISHQKTIQDQNYSNEIFFGVMSTLESLLLALQNKQTSHFGKKMFGSYDRNDYSAKNIAELKSQLQTQITVFQASRIVFAEENHGVEWQLPKNYSLSQAMSFLDQAIVVFQQHGQNAVALMTRDLQQLLNGKLNGLHVEKNDYRVTYSKEEKDKQRKNILQNGIYAAEEMDKRNEEIKNVNDRNQLQAKLNWENNYFNQNKPQGMDVEAPLPENSHGLQSYERRALHFSQIQFEKNLQLWVLLLDKNNKHLNFKKDKVDILSFETNYKDIRIFNHRDGILAYMSKNPSHIPYSMKCYQVGICPDNKLEILNTLECYYSLNEKRWRLH